jgi:hypothetical protein
MSQVPIPIYTVNFCDTIHSLIRFWYLERRELVHFSRHCGRLQLQSPRLNSLPTHRQRRIEDMEKLNNSDKEVWTTWL